MSLRKLDTAFFSRRSVTVDEDRGFAQSPTHVLNITRASTDGYAVTPFSWTIIDRTGSANTGGTIPPVTSSASKPPAACYGE